MGDFRKNRPKSNEITQKVLHKKCNTNSEIKKKTLPKGNVPDIMRFPAGMEVIP